MSESRGLRRWPGIQWQIIGIAKTRRRQQRYVIFFMSFPFIRVRGGACLPGVAATWWRAVTSDQTRTNESPSPGRAATEWGAATHESHSRRPGDTINCGDGVLVAGRDVRSVSFAPPGRHDQEHRRSGGPRRTCLRTRVTFARSNESPPRRLVDSNE